MNIRVRFALPEDYPAVSRVHNSHNAPHLHTTAERMLRADERSAERDSHFRRVIAEVGDRVVGTGDIRSNWAGVVQPGRFWLGLSVDPDWRGRSIDSQMLRYSLAGIDGEVRELATCIREDYIQAAGFLQDFGFEERFRSWGAHLDLRTFDPAPFEEAVIRLERSGFRFVPYTELESPANDARLLELKREIDRDVLSFEPVVPADSVDILGEEYVRSGLIVALTEEGDFVGLASLRRTSGDGGVDCGLTGVLREYRRRGIATALKVRSLAVAKEMGATEVGTGGGGTDSPMKRLNQKLGFQMGPEWATFITRSSVNRAKVGCSLGSRVRKTERKESMSKLHVILATTLDGFVADNDGGMDWIVMGDERADYMVEAIKNADTLMMGRKTYQGFVSWRDVPNNPAASEAEKAIGERFNAMNKVVFSRSLEKADWEGTTISRDIVPEEIQKLKAESERGIRLDGSISIVQQLTRLGLIDEYRLMVHPVVLGSGRPLFEERVDLELIGSEQFGTGVMVLTYKLAANSK